MNYIKKIWYLFGFEASVWVGGLAFLILINTPNETHFTICPISNLGLDFCPGCGLGNSISYIFKGDFISSYNSHPFGLIALAIITLRIISIININRRNNAKRISVNAKS